MLSPVVDQRYQAEHKRCPSKSVRLGGSLDDCGIRLETPQLGVNVQYICDVEAAGRTDFTTLSWTLRLTSSATNGDPCLLSLLLCPCDILPLQPYPTRATVESGAKCARAYCGRLSAGHAAFEFTTPYRLAGKCQPPASTKPKW